MKNKSKHFVPEEDEVQMSLPPQLTSNLVKANPRRGSAALSPEDVNPETMEGWIIQCPQSMDLREILIGQKINMDGSSSFLIPPQNDMMNGNGHENGVDATTYEAVAVKKNDQDESAFLILSDEVERQFKLASVPLVGCISVRRKIEETIPPDVKIRRKRSRKLPSGIKERHPIYGTDFSAALSSSTPSERKSKVKEGKKRKRKSKSPSPVEKKLFKHPKYE